MQAPAAVIAQIDLANAPRQLHRAQHLACFAIDFGEPVKVLNPSQCMGLIWLLVRDGPFIMSWREEA